VSRAIGRHEDQQLARQRLIDGDDGEEVLAPTVKATAQPDEVAEEEFEDGGPAVRSQKRKSAGGNVYHIHFH